MGLKLETEEGSRLGFFNSGCTTACLKAAGIEPEARILLTRARRTGATESRTEGSLRRRAGRQSEGQLEGRRCLTAAVREEREAGSNREKITDGGGGGEGMGEGWQTGA